MRTKIRETEQLGLQLNDVHDSVADPTKAVHKLAIASLGAEAVAPPRCWEADVAEGDIIAALSLRPRTARARSTSLRRLVEQLDHALAKPLVLPTILGALVPDQLEDERGQLDRRRQDTQTFALANRALGQSGDQIACTHDVGRVAEVRDPAEHVPAEPMPRECDVHSAFRNAERGDEKMRKTNELTQRQRGAHAWMIASDHADEAILEERPTIAPARELAKEADDEIELAALEHRHCMALHPRARLDAHAWGELAQATDESR